MILIRSKRNETAAKKYKSSDYVYLTCAEIKDSHSKQ